MAGMSWSELMSKAEAPTSGSGKLLSKGRYRAEIISKKVSERNGKDKLAICFKILAGAEADEKLWDNWTVSPESPVALGIFFQNFERCGGSLETLKMGGNLDAAAGPMVGKIVDFDLDIEEYPKGQTPPALRNKISRYYPVTAGSAAPVAAPNSTAWNAVEAPAAAVPKTLGVNGMPF